MKRTISLFIILGLCLSLSVAMAAGGGKSGSGKSGAGKVVAVKASKDTTLSIAAACIKRCEPKLKDKTKEAIDGVKDALAKAKEDPKKLKEVVGSLVDQFTMSLASAKSIDAITTGAAYLVQYAPTSQRTTNLLGSVLCADGRYPENMTSAILVFEYAVSIKPETRLIRLNLANAYLTAGKLDKALPVINKLIFEDQNDQSAWRAMATYYYKRQDYNHFREALLKASRFKGFVKKKTDKRNKNIEDNKVEGDESVAVIESKIEKIKDEVPFNTSEVIDEVDPAAAQKIRENYGKLMDAERVYMPKLPECNTNGPQEFERSEPIIEEWVKVMGSKTEKWIRKQALEKYGITGNESDAVMKAKAEAGAQKEAAKAMQQAKDMMAYMKNIPGMAGHQAEIDKAMRQLQTAGKQTKIGGKSIAPNLKDNPVDMEKIPGFDNGSPWAQMNYSNYFKVSHAYEMWMFKYFKEYNAKVMDIMSVYAKKVQAENDNHEQIWKRLQNEHEEEIKNRTDGPHHDDDIPCKREMLRWHKAINMLSVDYYHQWQGLYFPQYAQKMKPMLNDYWSTCALYIKNMNDPEVMHREYTRVMGNFMMYAMQACQGIGGGGAFKWMYDTEEEEAALQEAIRRSEEEAQAKIPQFEQEMKEPGIDWSKWIEDHLVVSISIEALKFKVSPKSIEFEAFLPFAVGGIKIDPINSTLETYSGSALKTDFGVNIFGVEAKVEDRVDFYRRTAKWDFDKGTYTETDTSSAETKGSFGPLNASAKVQLQYDTEITAKVDYKVGVNYKVPIKGSDPGTDSGDDQ